MKKLLVIDPQNDFCDIPDAALPVAGASADMERLGRFIAETQLDGITVTLDSHPSVAVERTTFWKTANGTAPAPFSFVTSDDVQSGKIAPRDTALTPTVLAMLQQLSQAGRPGLVIWPVHCVTGTWGHNIYSPLAEQLARWEYEHQRAVRKVLKGEYSLSEHFGVFEADAPVDSVPSTLFNESLAKDLTQGVDTLFIAGEAGSHCVASSFDQLTRFITQQGGCSTQLVLLQDCMSPVTGFESAQDALLARASAWGAAIMTCEQVIQSYRQPN